MTTCPEPAPRSSASPIPVSCGGSPRAHPKTGERRKRRRSLRIDLLPLALRDRIRAEHAAGHTWAEIEQDSPRWPEWNQAEPEALACFPDRRLPHSNLQRWHDLRVEQVMRERQAQSAAAHAAAEQVAARGFTDLTGAVKNALGEAVFELVLAGAGLDARIDALTNLSRVLARLDSIGISRQRLELQKRKAEALAYKPDQSQPKTGGLGKETAAEPPSEPAVPAESPVSQDSSHHIPPYPAKEAVPPLPGPLPQPEPGREQGDLPLSGGNVTQAFRSGSESNAPPAASRPRSAIVEFWSWSPRVGVDKVNAPA